MSDEARMNRDMDRVVKKLANGELHVIEAHQQIHLVQLAAGRWAITYNAAVPGRTESFELAISMDAPELRALHLALTHILSQLDRPGAELSTPSEH